MITGWENDMRHLIPVGTRTRGRVRYDERRKQWCVKLFDTVTGGTSPSPATFLRAVRWWNTWDEAIGWVLFKLSLDIKEGETWAQ